MKVCVVGCGVSGLAAIKTCKESSIDVVCYEQDKNIGGIWKYREETMEGIPSVAKSTVINVSKSLIAFSDFPPPKEFPNYMHNKITYKYLQMYAEEFSLIPHVKFYHRVEKIVQFDDYETTGKWTVATLNLQSGEENVEIFDAVMICSGHHAYPNTAKFEGQEKFQGRITHTHSYKRPNEFEDKKVVVVGVGNSGVDAAVETSNVADKVYLSTRRGCWILPRVGLYGKPNDEFLLTRFLAILKHFVPFNITDIVLRHYLNIRFDHGMYQLKPKHGVFQQHPTANDALPSRILNGTVTVKGNIQRFESNGVIFEGDNEITEVDEVILATGYDIKFPFLNKDVIDTKDNRVHLYKLIFPPHLKHNTLAFIGLFQPYGGAFPISEMQCRWFVEVLKKNVFLPDREEMKKDITEMISDIDRRYYNSKRHSIQVDYVEYLDDLATKIKVKPNFLRLFFSDPKLFWALLMGPSLPYQYRLQGPHSWPQARKVILEHKERSTEPLKNKIR
ncbi:flavin-containing monooxygenase 5-like [Centruroides vittatus]|uniref:flavin-containing monooxygenase 5-like n=1 Tax=Centruroides vittatus TaxID=120091 RepID=UPI00350F33A2